MTTSITDYIFELTQATTHGKFWEQFPCVMVEDYDIKITSVLMNRLQNRSTIMINGLHKTIRVNSF